MLLFFVEVVSYSQYNLTGFEAIAVFKNREQAEVCMINIPEYKKPRIVCEKNIYVKEF